MLDVEPPSCSAHPESSGRGTPRVLTRVGSAAVVVRDTPSPPQALPAASEAEKRSDGRRRAGSCLGVATLLRQGPSLLVGSRSQHKGGGFSQPGRVPLQSNGKRGNIRDDAGAAQAPRKDPRDRPWPGREGAGPDLRVPQGREVTFPRGCSEPFPSWETLMGSSCGHRSPQASSQRHHRATGCGARDRQQPPGTSLLSVLLPGAAGPVGAERGSARTPAPAAGGPAGGARGRRG